MELTGSTDTGGFANFKITADSTDAIAGSANVDFYLSGNTGFSMSGFDVAASDASAHMTVDGVQYSIAKAVKVKINGDTYFWPLFGPV
jgi:hypothetical protein